MKAIPNIRVIDMETREVVHVVPMPNPTRRRLERVERGLLMRVRPGLLVDTSEVDAVLRVEGASDDT